MVIRASQASDHDHGRGGRSPGDLAHVCAGSARPPSSPRSSPPAMVMVWIWDALMTTLALCGAFFADFLVQSA